MSDYEQKLQTRVDRKFKPLMRLIWSGFFSGVIWIILIVAVIADIISGEVLATLGLLSLILPAITGILYSQEMIKIDMIDKEEKRMAELGLLEKRKNYEPERLRLQDDGELVGYDDMYEDESQSRYSGQ